MDPARPAVSSPAAPLPAAPRRRRSERARQVAARAAGLLPLRRIASPRGLLTLGPVLAVTLIGGSLSWQYNALVRGNRELVVHTQRVLLVAQRLQILAEDAETAQRGYLLTDDPEFLEPFAPALRDLPGAFAELHALVRDNGGQIRRLDALDDLLATKVAHLRETVRLHGEGQRAAVRAMVADGTGKRAMDALRAALGQITAEEQRLLAARTERVRLQERWLVLVGVATGVASVLARSAILAWVRRRRRRVTP